MALLARGCLSATSHSILRSLGPEGWAKLLIEKRVFLLFFPTLYGLFASIPDSASGNPQLKGNSTVTNVGEAHKGWCGSWGQMNLGSNPAGLYPGMILAK